MTSIENLILPQPLRLELRRVGGAWITTVFSGNRPCKTDRETAEAAAALMAGRATAKDVQVLLAAGLLLAKDAAAELPARPVLAPYTDLALKMSPLEVGLAKGKRPFSPTLPGLSTAWSIPPRRLLPMFQLHRRLAHRWRAEVHRVVATGSAVDKPGLCRVLETLAREALAADFDLNSVVDDEGSEVVHFVPLVPLLEQELPYQVKGAKLWFDRDAAERAIACPARDREELRALVATLGSLARGDGDVLAHSAGSEAALECTQALLARQMIKAAPERGPAPPLAEGHVLHLGHGALLARIGDAVLLIDPWLHAASAQDRLVPPLLPVLPRPDAVLVTRCALDTASVSSLLRLGPSVPVYYPADPMFGGAGALLEHIGFRHLHAVTAGDVVRVGRAVCTARRWARGDMGVAWDVEAEGRGFLAMGERAVDPEGLGHRSPVFASRQPDVLPRLFEDWSALLLPSSRWMESEEEALQPRLVAVTEAASPRVLVVYREGGAGWRAAQRPQGDRERAAEDRGWPSLAALHNATGVPVHAAEPYDLFEIGGGSAGSWKAHFAR